MTVPLRSHANVRSYFFREAIAELDREHRQYGGRHSIDDYCLEDFRPLWRAADRNAREWRRQATNVYNPATRQWEQRQ